MNKSTSDRLIKNEQIIRDKNVAASKGIKKYFQYRKSIKNSPIAFVCECSKLDCNEHVSISISSYEQLHKRGDYFTIYPGHDVPKIEKIVAKQSDFDVVEKFALSPNSTT